MAESGHARSAAVATVPDRRIAEAVDARMPMAARLLEDIRAGSRDGDGVTRASYGAGEQMAHAHVRRAATEIGLDVTTDAAGNLYATLPGSDRAASRWISGSHLDSVPQGGNFDGAAGAVAALTALAALKDIGVRTAGDLVAMAIRAEECSSWFTGHHGGHLGSRAALGLLKAEELETAVHIGTGRTFGQSIDDAGFDSLAVRTAPPALSPGSTRGFVELHIEQGPVLAHAGLPVGIVTSIRGNLRFRDAACLGAYSHSGAVPQELRQDAVLATSEFVHRLDDTCSGIRDQGGDVVFTVGRLHTDAAADSLSKVPGEVRFTIDIRSQDLPVLQRLGAAVDALAAEIGGRRNVRFELGRRSLSEPTRMDEGARARLVEGARRLQIPARELACGAGHDAADFARAGIPACMIFVRNTGESHNPDEHMELDDFRHGARLLAWFLAGAG